MYFSTIVNLSLTFGGLGLAMPPHVHGDGRNTSLYKAMRHQGRSFIGTALTLRNETAEPMIVKQEFNSITPENAMKWESTEPTRGNFTFADGDQYVNFTKKNGIQLHCHNLVWHSQLPPYVTDGKFDNATLIAVMEEHIKALAGRWKGSCTRWDVVNEALDEDGTYRKSVWYNTTGEAFIPIAFRLAAKYDPHARLFYNDYNLEANNAKTLGAKRIVKLIKSYGLRIDGVGYQAHISSESTPTSPEPAPNQTVLEQAFHATADEGVDVHISELDVRMNTPATAEKLEVQKQVYERVAKACLAVKRCVGMTVWGISDKYSWIPGTFPGEGAANVWDDNYQKKPAYAGFLKGIVGSNKTRPHY